MRAESELIYGFTTAFRWRIRTPAARTAGRFVTFWCVPYKDCAAFDSDGNDHGRELANKKSISVRQVEMKGDHGSGGRHE